MSCLLHEALAKEDITFEAVDIHAHCLPGISHCCYPITLGLVACRTIAEKDGLATVGDERACAALRARGVNNGPFQRGPLTLECVGVG